MGIECCLAGGQPQHRYPYSPISCGVRAGSGDCLGSPQPAGIDFSFLKGSLHGVLPLLP